ncbi:hypothetical protein [Clostridium saccharoperbutylacetonicum]|uniref:hypothetical protein n=1 Tax=Clostridium saccharoperbutylacetonicum TaxID=36745 RepID=UPI0039E9B7D7
MKKESTKKRALKHIKRGLHHLNINHSVDIKNISKEVRTFIKNNKYFSEKELYELLRKKIRKGVSNKWKGSIKWNKECNRILALLKMNINEVVIDEGWMFYTESKNYNISEMVEIVKNEINKIRVSNDTTTDDIEKVVGKVVDDNKIRVEIINDMKLFATITQPGKFKFTVKVTEKSTEEFEVIQSIRIIEMLQHNY